MERVGRAIYIKDVLGLTAWRAACYWSSALKPDIKIRVARRQRWYGFEARLNDSSGLISLWHNASGLTEY
jgi:hypothetical protein